MYEPPEDRARRDLSELQTEYASCRRTTAPNLFARLLPHVRRLNRRLETWLARRAHPAPLPPEPTP
jgi:hypothetical protein